MREPWAKLRANVKHILAGSLFVTIVICGCAVAFFLFATGISSLANADAASQQYVKKSPVIVVAPQNTSQADESSESINNTQSIQSTQSISKSDELLSTMHSPIGDAIDNGGVMVGQKVQQAFGSMLKGVLTTLFLEQNDDSNPSPGGGTNG